MSKQETSAAYLGDGVYASFDGWDIWLAVNDHTKRVVCLEPEVMAKLIAFRDRHYSDRHYK
jgi:hypothetical protein